MDILHSILTEAKSLAKQELKLHVIFDLDSTIFEVRFRSQKILQEFTMHPEHLREFPEDCKHLSEVQIEPSDWGLRTAIERHKFVPSSDKFVLKLIEFWRARFFSNDYLHLDHPYEGAVDYILALHKAGAKISYLTGRDVQRMGEGTVKSLKQWGLPTEIEGAEVIMKPQKGIVPDAEFKRDVLAKMAAPIWLFENEPKNIHLVAAECPHVRMVYFDSTHSGLADPPKTLPTIDTYRLKSF